MPVVALALLLPSWAFGVHGFAEDAFVLNPPRAPFWTTLLSYGYPLALSSALLTVIALARAARPEPTDPRISAV